jgi:hypothetical protein
MGSGLKKKTAHKGLTYAHENCYTPNKKYNDWNVHCIRNNIRISPKPTRAGMYPEEWRIEVRLGPYKKGEKAYLTPNVYTIHNVFQEIERMKKYYYDKKK